MPRLRWLEICGFRVFADAQRLDFSNDVTLIWGPSSQGKTSVAEAIEFLMTGAIIRRELLGGAKAEFERCLRNVHLDPNAPVWVKAGIADEDGREHQVCRTLSADYTGERECESELTIDGAVANDLETLGISLADPPLRAPVLLQHTMRFALSARPQDRANYFKALVEVQDLERVRDRVVALRPLLEATQTPAPIEQLRQCASIPALSGICGEIERHDLDEAALESKLAEALEQGLKIAGVTTNGNGAGLAVRVAALRSAVAARSEESFALSAYAVPPKPSKFELPSFERTNAYTQLARDADAELDRLRRVFEAVLAVPAVADTTHAIDCPVCETPAALTPERVVQMRAQVAESVGLREGQRQASAELSALKRQLEQVAFPAGPPAAAALDEAELRRHEALVVEMLGQPEPHRDLVSRLPKLVEARDSVSTTVAAAVEAIDDAMSAVRGAVPADAEALATPCRAVRDALDSAGAVHDDYAATSVPLLQPLRDALDRRQGTEHWRQLAEIAEDPRSLLQALNGQHARARVRAELEQAVSDIDSAKGKVFDQKFGSMSAEIQHWWKLLRPDEAVQFDSVRRRGSGRRFVDFKARLHPRPNASGVERDALGVFSESQLNALGLAAFLARSRLQSAPFVVLDDPVQAGDDEHRATFVAHVVKELADQGMQTIVLTYDAQTSKQMHHTYEHLPLDGFAVTLDTPESGARVVQTANTADALLQQAQAYLHHDDEAIRAVAAGKMRIAAERLAKEILVRRRTDGGEVCSLADYNDKTLGPLIGDLVPYLSDQAHPGQWRVVGDLLNPGSHDDTPPSKADMRQAHGYLRGFWNYYLTPAA